jgi:hypothetical protein
MSIRKQTEPSSPEEPNMTTGRDAESRLNEVFGTWFRCVAASAEPAGLHSNASMNFPLSLTTTQPYPFDPNRFY